MPVEVRAWIANEKRMTGRLTFLLRRPKPPKLVQKSCRQLIMERVGHVQMKLGCHLTAKNAAQFNHNKGIRLDACQRMKSANGFFEKMLHHLEPFIRWGKKTCGNPAEMIQVLDFSCARISRYLSRHSARETFPRALASSDGTNHHSRGTCQPGSFWSRNCFNSPVVACGLAATHATMRSARSAFPPGTPKTRHSATASCPRKTCSMVAGDTLRPATLIWSLARPRRETDPVLKFPKIAGLKSATAKRVGTVSASTSRPLLDFSPGASRPSRVSGPRCAWAGRRRHRRCAELRLRRRRCRRIQRSRRSCGF